MIWLAGGVVFAGGVWLVGLAVALIGWPEPTGRFLRGFASTPRAHYTEQLLRLAAGWALITYAPRMRFPVVFTGFGWIMVISVIGLLLLPWRWHKRFAETVVPIALRFIRLYALGALLLGCLLLYSLLPEMT